MLYLVALTFTLLLENIQTICLSGQFWNPLNNACVNGKYFLLHKNVRGMRPTFITQTPLPTHVF